MTALALLLIVPATFVSALLTRGMIAVGHRLNALDAAGVPGQVKAPPRRVPNTGGVAIAATLLVFIAGGLLMMHTPAAALLTRWAPSLHDHLPGLRARTPEALWLLGGLVVLHVLGVIDDRRPLPALPKLMLMLAVCGVVCIATDTRLLMLLDGLWDGTPLAALGWWASVLLTVTWMVLVTNAMNFLDNMDGLSGGVGLVAGSCFLAAALIGGQWFVALVLAVMLGAVLGFLVFNFPLVRPARIFMGDGGSLVIGFLLGFLTVRTTYYDPALAGGWYGVLAPLMVLAVPLYDLVAVSIIRLSQGRSPFVGDLQHLSHRLVRRGLSRRDAVLVILGLTGVTAIAAVPLPRLAPWQAALLGAQTLLVLGLVALFERRAAAPRNSGEDAR